MKSGSRKPIPGGPLTEKQRVVLEFIRDYLGRNRATPTLREIGDEFGFNGQSANNHVRSLIAKGRLRRPRPRCHALEILSLEGTRDE